MGCIFLRCGSKSKKLLMSLEGTKPCEFFGPRANKLLAGLEQILPHKNALLRAMPIKGIVRFGWQFLRLAPTARVCYLKRHASTITTVVVHSCLQLRLIKHEWGTSFFDVGASLKNCSCRLKEQSHAGSSAPERTNCLRAWIKSSPIGSSIVH